MKQLLFLLIAGSVVFTSCSQTVNLNRVKGIRGGCAPAITSSGIKFSISAPEATLVTIIGNFNGWNSQATQLIKGRDGIWSTTLPLKSGHKYYYKYIVDGYVIADPDNPEFEADGSGSVNSIITVK